MMVFCSSSPNGTLIMEKTGNQGYQNALGGIKIGPIVRAIFESLNHGKIHMFGTM